MRFLHPVTGTPRDADIIIHKTKKCKGQRFLSFDLFTIYVIVQDNREMNDKDWPMQIISLNQQLFKQCVDFAESIDRRGAACNYRDSIYKACVFLFAGQGKEFGSLKYCVFGGSRGLEITEFRDAVPEFGPHPVIIDTHRINRQGFKISEAREGRIDLEIPSSTWAAYQSFHDKDRPKWVQVDDLKTTIVRVGGKVADLAYIGPRGFDGTMNLPLANAPFESFCWNKNEKSTPEIFKDAIFPKCRCGKEQSDCPYDIDFEYVHRVLKGKSDCFCLAPTLPTSVHMFEREIVDEEKSDFDDDDNWVEVKTIYQMPVAKWDVELDNPRRRVRMIISGRALGRERA